MMLRGKTTVVLMLVFKGCRPPFHEVFHHLRLTELTPSHHPSILRRAVMAVSFVSTSGHLQVG